VTLWDERNTTVSANAILNHTNVRGTKRKKTVDTVAAVLLLESFLSYRKNNPKINPLSVDDKKS
jgi:putative Holliday junction resolvase